MLVMDAIHVGDALLMRDKAQFKDIFLFAAHIGGRLALSSSTVTGTLNMNNISVDEALFMNARSQFKEIDLTAAHIGGELLLDSSTITSISLYATHIGGRLNLSGSTVTGRLNINNISVDQNLAMGGSQFKEIDLTGAHIGKGLDLSSSTVTGKLNMNGIRVDRDLIMRDKAHFKEIDLSGAHIGGQLDLRNSTVTGKLAGDYIDVAQTMFLDGATFADEIDLTSAKLGQDLYLSSGIFNKNVDLSGAQIGGVLGLESAQWLGSASLNLTGAAAGEIDLSHSWPDKIYLSGLTYRNLSNISENISQQAKTWLGKQAYTPQPYEQLASVLQSNGRIEDATKIRYAGKEQERKATPWGLYRFWLGLLDWSIGFGYYLQFAFYWGCRLRARGLGGLVFRRAENQARRHARPRLQLRYAAAARAIEQEAR